MMADPTLTDLVEEIVLVGVAITTRALSDASPGLDLTFPQWRALLLVGDRPNGLTISEVAAGVGVTVPATSRQLHRLAERGLLEIAPDERDRRASRVRLTAPGAEVRDRILRFRRERLTEAVGGLAVSELTLRELTLVARTLAAAR